MTDSHADRGVLYIAWGPVGPALDRSIASLRRHHPELPVLVDRIDAPAGASREGLLRKAAMGRITPFRETLYLDADTVVLGRLDFGFAKAVRHGLACCICECPWLRRYGALGLGDEVEYNTGVLFFTPAARAAMAAWERLAASVDSSILHVETGERALMPFNDQAAFGLALERTATAPFVLPLNWNLRQHWQPTCYGPVKIWHSYRPVPPSVHRINAFYANPDAILQQHEV